MIQVIIGSMHGYDNSHQLPLYECTVGCMANDFTLAYSALQSTHLEYWPPFQMFGSVQKWLSV